MDRAVTMSQGVGFLKALNDECEKRGIGRERFKELLNNPQLRGQMLSTVLEILDEKPVMDGMRARPRIILDFDEFKERWEKVETVQEASGLLHAVANFYNDRSSHAPLGIKYRAPLPSLSAVPETGRKYYERIGKERLERFQFLRGSTKNTDISIISVAENILWENFVCSLHLAPWCSFSGGEIYSAWPVTDAVEVLIDFALEQAKTHPYAPIRGHIADFCIVAAALISHKNRSYANYSFIGNIASHGEQWTNELRKYIPQLIEIAKKAQFACPVQLYHQEYTRNALRVIYPQLSTNLYGVELPAQSLPTDFEISKLLINFFAEELKEL